MRTHKRCGKKCILAQVGACSKPRSEFQGCVIVCTGWHFLEVPCVLDRHFALDDDGSSELDFSLNDKTLTLNKRRRATWDHTIHGIDKLVCTIQLDIWGH